MKTKHKILSVLTVLAVVASLMAVTAAPAAATPTPTIMLHPSSGPVGTVVRVFGSGLPLNTVGNLTAVPVGVIPITPFMTTGAGTIDLTVTILPGAPAAPSPGALAIFTATVGAVAPTAEFRVIVLPPEITLAPTSGVPGTAVTVTGVRFPANAPGVLEGPGRIAPVTFMTTAAGAIPATVVTILPGATTGNITALVGGIAPVHATFTVIPAPAPTLTITFPVPPSGPRGTLVTVNGTAFPLNAHGIITAPGVITPEPFLTDGAGGFIDTVTILGVAPFGLQTITATVGLFSATAHFVVAPTVPSITLAQTAGARGTMVTVTGSGFPVGATGVIVAPGVIAPRAITTHVDGTILPIPLPPITILPDAPFGPATITVTVGVVSASAPFTVNAPSITLAPVGGVPGAVVSVTGVGFPPGVTGFITAPGVIAPTPFTTHAAGVIPPAIAGAFLATPATILLGAPSGLATFTATADPDGPGPLPAVTATATYTVGITPAITLTPAIGFGGTTVTVTGFGFPPATPGSTITAPGVISPVSFSTDTHGRILPPATITILAGAPVGLQTITVTVDPPGPPPAVVATASFTVAGPGVPIIVPEPVVPVLKGLEVIREQLGESVWHFRAGNWYQFHTDPAKHDLIPLPRRLVELRSGDAYWIYLEKPITDVLVGGVRRTLPAGWHNIGWVL
jgi:hypothetical protein